MKNLYLKKGKSLGSSRLPKGGISAVDADLKLSDSILKALEKNIEGLLAKGILIEGKQANAIDAEIVLNKQDEDAGTGEDAGTDEGEDAGTDEDAPLLAQTESGEIKEVDWKELLNEGEQEVYEFLKSKKIKELKEDLKRQEIAFKSKDNEDTLIKLCMGK